MVPGASDLPGEGLDVLTQCGKMLGNRLDILAECLLARHFGVFRGHLVLLLACGAQTTPSAAIIYVLGCKPSEPPNCAVTIGFIVPVAGILAFGKRTT
jgi:hypothetical protein